MNRSLSIRSSGTRSGPSTSQRFTFSSLRGNITQPELAKKLYKLIKTENGLISSYESSAKDLRMLASQLSEWGEDTGDESVSDLSDKIGVLLSEHAELEDAFASQLEESRGLLKHIRNMEASVASPRDHKAKLTDQIGHLKIKDASSPKIMTMEQELVRAEAEELVANAQLSNVTRQKLKEAYLLHFVAAIERAEKQAILARHGRRLLELLDETPIVPGDAPIPYNYEKQAKQVLLDAEEELETWRPDYDQIESAPIATTTLAPSTSLTANEGAEQILGEQKMASPAEA